MRINENLMATASVFWGSPLYLPCRYHTIHVGKMMPSSGEVLLFCPYVLPKRFGQNDGNMMEHLYPDPQVANKQLDSMHF